jgi:hypothetical protein
MNINDVKSQLSQLTAAERDDIRAYLSMLDSNEEMAPLSDEVWQEIMQREAAYAAGEMSAQPIRAFLSGIKK